MFKHIIARTPARSLVDGLTSSHSGRPDYARVLEQHNVYIHALQTCDVDITLLSPDERFPDPVFVEDPVFCTSHYAITTRPGAESWRGETEIIKETVQCFYPGKVECIEAPGTVEAGDIMTVGDHFYIGESVRTNAESARQMIAILEKHGLSSSVVHLEKVLYLKTGLAYLEHNNLLAAGEFISKPEFQDSNIIEISEEELYVVNCIWINERAIIPAGYPRTHKKTARLGYRVVEVDTSEYRKIDGGVSCMSLRF